MWRFDYADRCKFINLVQLTWHGLACFRLQADGASLITDPVFTGSGLRGPRLAANVVTLADRAAKIELPGSDVPVRLINGPGEYEAAGILVEGTALARGANRVAYRIVIDGISVVTFGMLPTLPPAEAVAALTGSDVLLLPVGGGPVLSAAQATELINLLEPRIVVPCAYRIPGLTLKLEALDKFCKEIGVCPTEELPKLKLTRKDLPAGEMKVIVLAKA